MWCNHMYIYIYIVYMRLLIPKEAIDAPSIWFGFQASFWWCRSSCHWDTPSLIDECHIPCYGAKAPINQSFLGNIYIHIIIHVYIYIHNIYIYTYTVYVYTYIYNPYWTHVSGVCPIIQRRLEGSSCLVWVWLPFSLGSLECLAEKSGANKEPRKLFFFFFLMGYNGICII